MTNKIPEGQFIYNDFPYELFVGGGRGDLRAPPHASKPTAHKDKLKNVTPKEPVQLELPFEEKSDDC